MKFLNRFKTEANTASNVFLCLLTGIFVFFLIVIQTTWIHAIEIFRVVPCLTFVFCVCYSIKKGGLLPIIISLACGFVLDALNAGSVGVDALLYMYISLGCVWLNECLFNKSLKVIMLCVLAASLLYTAASFGVYFFIWGETRIGFAFTHKMLPETVYNLVITPVLYPFACRCAGEKVRERGIYRE